MGGLWAMAVRRLTLTMITKLDSVCQVWMASLGTHQSCASTEVLQSCKHLIKSLCQVHKLLLDLQCVLWYPCSYGMITASKLTTVL